MHPSGSLTELRQMNLSDITDKDILDGETFYLRRRVIGSSRGDYCAIPMYKEGTSVVFQVIATRIPRSGDDGPYSEWKNGMYHGSREEKNTVIKIDSDYGLLGEVAVFRV